MFIATAAAIYSLGHGLCTFTAVPRSTQPSSLRGTVKWVSAYGLINNNNGGLGVDGSSYFFGGLTAQIVWHGLRAGGHPALSLRSFNGVGRMGKVQGPRVSGKIFKIIFQIQWKLVHLDVKHYNVLLQHSQLRERVGEIDLQIWGVNCTKCVWPPGPGAGAVALHQSP